MPCFSPVSCWKPPAFVGPTMRVDHHTGELLAGTTGGLSFQPRDGWDHIHIGCGRCDGCLASSSMEWAIRSYHEASLHDRNSFLTLTYESDSQKVIDKEHLQNFFKRARHKYKFRYLACGEYGAKTRRPHYHALIFGEDFLGGSFQVSDTLYSNHILSKLWGHGFVSIGSLTMESCCYVSGYVLKKRGDSDTFRLSSSRPGIGHAWLDRFHDDIARTGCVVIEGREYPAPRRYLNWEDWRLREVKLNRADKIVKPTTLADEREEVRHLKAKQKTRAQRLKQKREML